MTQLDFKILAFKLITGNYKNRTCNKYVSIYENHILYNEIMIATLSINLATILIDEDDMWIKKKKIIDSTNKKKKPPIPRSPKEETQLRTENS